MLIRTNRFLLRLPRGALTIGAAAVLGLVGFLDYLSGYQVSFSLFYLGPVSAAAWYAGRRAGITLAVVASFVWYGVELASGYTYDHPIIPVWNALVRLGFFLIVTLLLASLRRHLANEQRLARTDPLTGVMNARAFTERLARDLALCDRTRSPLTLAYVDLDDFKQVNDRYGHTGGDELLRTIGRTLRGGTRRTDTVARLGGDEFAMILPGADLDGASHLVAELRQLVDNSQAQDGPSTTCSIGAVVFNELPGSADGAIAAADGLMYEAKKSGKNAAVFGVYSSAGVQRVLPVPALGRSAGRGGHPDE